MHLYVVRTVQQYFMLLFCADARKCSTWPKKRIYFDTGSKFSCSGNITHYQLCSNETTTYNLTLIVHIWGKVGDLHTRGSAVVRARIRSGINSTGRMIRFAKEGGYNTGDYLGYEIVQDVNNSNHRYVMLC